MAKWWWEQEGSESEGIRTAAQEEEWEGGGGGDRWDGDGYGRLIRWEDTAENIILGAKPNDTLAYDLGLELHNPIMSMIGGHRGQLYR